MDHPLSCRCGTLRGIVRHSEKASHGVCYCKDCQAYAHFLGKAKEILDEVGGTEIVTALQKNVTFTHGVERLTCMSLAENGTLRWYANCCNTPIGNTVRDFKASFVGLVHSCLRDRQSPLERSFGPVRMWVNTRSAKGKVQSMPLSTLSSAIKFTASLIRARIDGSYKHSPFFDPLQGTPVVAPKVLSRSDRESLKNAV